MSSVAHAGKIGIGGENPIRLQSMTNTSTLDTAGSADQIIRIADAGGEIVRLTTQGVREAANMKEIREEVRRRGCDVPLVADVHFNPKAASEAALHCDKVRINPGNFVDAARTFVKLEFSDEEYREEIEKIRKALVPFLDICKAHGTCVRLGVNHGSLSDRIMSRYGDTAPGMVESVMEFLRICREEDFDNIVISIKASNTVVMVETVRLLVKEMEKEGMRFPIHLGVTEAGDGEDGRVKSAVGIATLLNEGIGDTIRVSLSEDPEKEIPVAAMLRDYITAREGHSPIAEPFELKEGKAREHSVAVDGFAKGAFPVIRHDLPQIPADWHRADAHDVPFGYHDLKPVVLHSNHRNPVGEISSWIDRFVAAGGKNPVILSFDYTGVDSLEELQVKAGADLGTLLMNGYGDGIELTAKGFDSETLTRLALGILQAARLRVSRTEYIACPSCGRTLFDLQKTLKEVKEATADLKGLKIGVMGCIVNGPGEMADADYGYVGAGPGRVSIYRRKELVHKNIPTEEALTALLDLIRSDNPS